MKKNELLYLSQADVEAVGLTMAEILAALETAFREKGEGRVEMPPKPGIHPGGGDNFIHAMPAYIPALESAGIKWVSGFPGNSKRGLPYITGLLHPQRREYRPATGGHGLRLDYGHAHRRGNGCGSQVPGPAPSLRSSVCWAVACRGAPTSRR